MAVEPEKDAAKTAEETSKAEAAKNWEERRASRPSAVPSASEEPFKKSPSTRPPPLDLELSQPAQPVAAPVPPPEENPAAAAPKSIDPESSVETVRTIPQEGAPANEAPRIATSNVGDHASPRLAPREPEPQTEPGPPPATEPLPPGPAAAAAFAALESNILGKAENKPKADASASEPQKPAERVVASSTKTAPMMDPVVVPPPAAAPPDRPKTDPMLDHIAAPPAAKISAPPARDEQIARAVDVPAPAPAPLKSTPPIAPPAVGGPLAAFETLARSARLADLVALTESIVREAATTRSTYWTFTAKVARAAEEARLGRSDADTPFGNALDVLGRGAENASENALACALWAHAVCEATSGGKKGSEAEDALAGDILWLATHTSFDATPLLDRALGEDAPEIWMAIAGRVRKIAKSGVDTLGRGEAIVGCAALASSGASRAKALCTELASEVEDPVLVRLLATGESATPDEVRLEGEMIPSPRGPVMTAFLAVSGILFVVHAARFIARVALAYKRPTEVSLSDAGVRVKTRTEMLGRTLREREHVIVRSGLVRVVREVRYPRLAFYAGLLALVIGSYIGVRAFADGVRAASPSLLVVGLVIVAIGIGADFLLGTVLPGARGRVRLAFVPRSGAVLCVGDIDARRADDALARTLKTRA